MHRWCFSDVPLVDADLVCLKHRAPEEPLALVEPLVCCRWKQSRRCRRSVAGIEAIGTDPDPDQTPPTPPGRSPPTLRHCCWFIIPYAVRPGRAGRVTGDLAARIPVSGVHMIADRGRTVNALERQPVATLLVTVRVMRYRRGRRGVVGR
jgi:hypothetical protein